MPGNRCQPQLWPPPPGFYDHTVRLTKGKWAWEFLRRNPAFVRHWHAPGKSFADVSDSDISPVPRVELLRWGVLFRRYTLHERCVSTGDLGSGSVPTPDAPDGARCRERAGRGSLQGIGFYRRMPDRPSRRHADPSHNPIRAGPAVECARHRSWGTSASLRRRCVGTGQAVGASVRPRCDQRSSRRGSIPIRKVST